MRPSFLLYVEREGDCDGKPLHSHLWKCNLHNGIQNTQNCDDLNQANRSLQLLQNFADDSEAALSECRKTSTSAIGRPVC